MIIDKSMLAKFLVTVIVVGSVGYYAMYTFWPAGPISTVEPLDAPATALPQNRATAPEEPMRDYFVEHRMERDRERSERIELLREVVNNANTTSEARSKAQMAMIEVAAQKEVELYVERLIVGKGFADAVVFFGPVGAEIIVKAESLSEPQALQIADVVTTVAGIKLQNVRVRFRK
ncbi:MAG: SpoIIIAH-like family protein [Bacillota bacterium]|nr:SpoIIIAH-like family protein [Bacillota bacterium]